MLRDHSIFFFIDRRMPKLCTFRICSCFKNTYKLLIKYSLENSSIECSKRLDDTQS